MPIDAGSPKAARRFSKQRAKAKPRRRPAPAPRPVVRATPPAPQRRYIGPENRPPAPARRRSTLPKNFHTDSQKPTTKSQRKAIDRNAKQVKRRVDRKSDRAALRLALRQSQARPFGKQPDESLRRSTREGVQALADLQASNPRKYERNRHSALSNTVRDVGGAGDKALKTSAKFLNEHVLQDRHAGRAALAGGPDVGRTAREAVDLISNLPSSTYLTGAAAYEGYRGRPQRARKLVRDFKKTSALYPAFKGDLGEAAHRAGQRPLTTALELQGAKALVGRTGGAVARSGVAGKTVKRAGSTERPNLKLYDPKREGPGPEIQRQYSRDIINKGIQKYAERRTQKGSRVRKDGTQRRPGRDPHVDQGSRLVPPNPLAEDRGRAPVIRRRLRRRVDTRVHAQQRVIDARRAEAAKKAKGDLKHPQRRAKLETMARADKVRNELQQRLAKTSKAKVRKDLRRLLALDDRALLQHVDRVANGRMGPAGAFTRHYTPDEQAVIVKSLERRVRRGKPITPEQKAALDAAVGRQIARDVTKRNTPREVPGAAVARSQIAAALGKAPEGWEGVVERRMAPRPGPRLDPLKASDFGEYFAKRQRTMRVKPQRAQPSKADQELAALRPAERDLVPSAVNRRHLETIAEQTRLTADEFGIGPALKTSAGAKNWAIKNRPDGNLVPFKVADKEWRLIPREVHNQFKAHQAVDNSILGPGSPIDRATGVFKDVVLTSSSPSKWLGGNIGDIGMRTLFEGITPADIYRGMKIDPRLKKHGIQGEQASQTLHQGGLYTTGGEGILGQDIRSTGAHISKANVPRHVWRAWKKGIYTVEHAIESLPQYGRTGKAMRRETGRGVKTEDAHMKYSLKSLLKIQDQQFDHFAQKLATDRAMEARIQKNIEDVIGRWGKVSPGMRRSLSLAPFAQWLGAATRYVYVTLPVHHPIKTSILAGVSQMTEDERIRLGLSYFAPTDKRAPDYQMGMLPMKVTHNKYGPQVEGIRTARMTSLGTAGSSPWNIPEFLMPQIASGINALAGRSFTGDPLMYPDDAGKDKAGLPMDFIDRLPVAIGAQAESMVPFASAFRRTLLEQGRPSDPSSTILTPRTRPKFNYETKRFEDRPGETMRGLEEWAKPYAPWSRIYTEGAQRDIERSQNTLRQLEQWNHNRKVKQRTRDSYGPVQGRGKDDFWSTGGTTTKKKPAVRPKQTDEFWK